MRSHKPLINRYDQLTPEERFKLVLSAEARGDTNEVDSLESSATRSRWLMRDHVPWRRAFDEMVVFTFIDLIEAAHQWHEAWNAWSDICGDSDDPDPEDNEMVDRFYRVYLARGYIFQARVEAWKLFCDKLGTTPFDHWSVFPGYHHLQRDIDIVTQQAPDSRHAFTHDELIDHLNTIGDKPVSAIITADSLERDLEKAFGELVKGWGG